MQIWTWGFALSLTLSTIAAAQPSPAGPLPQPASPPPAPAPSEQPIAATPAPTAAVAAGEPGRPTELAVGIGVGYSFPTSLQTPNTTSVRLRLPSGLTFEPQVVVAATATDLDSGGTNRQSEITLGTVVRYPLRSHNKVDLELIGNTLISARVFDPTGDHNNRTTTTLGLGYGVALAYWLTPHWSLSITASNPLLSFVRTRQDTGPGTSNVDNATTIGLVFEPQVAAMLHLYL